jgi:hypothetical protein
MKQIYEISKVKTLVTFTRLEVDENGTRKIEHSQTRIFEGLPTPEEIVNEAKSRCDEGIEVVVSENLKE